MSDSVIARLWRAEARYQRAVTASEQARAHRDEAIRAAHASGMSQRAIAEHVSAGYQRVGQITKA